MRFIIKLGKGRGQVSIEMVVILGIVLIGAILVGSFYISSINKKTQGATDISGVTDDYDRWFNEPANNQGNSPTPPVPPTSVCGNGIIESGEECDGGVGTTICSDVDPIYISGILGCYSPSDLDHCKYDISLCTPNPLVLDFNVNSGVAQKNATFTVDLNSESSDVNYNLDINIFEHGLYSDILTTNCSYNGQFGSQFNLGNNLSPGIYHYSFNCSVDGQFGIKFNAVAIDNSQIASRYSDWGIYSLPLYALCSTTSNSFGTFTACASPNNGYGKSDHLEIFVNQQEVNYSCDSNGTNVLCITVG